MSEKLREVLADLLAIVGSASMDLEELLRGFLVRVLAFTGAERGMILRPTGGGRFEVDAALDRSGRPLERADRISRSLPAEAMRTRTGVVRVCEFERDRAPGQTPSMEAFRLRSVVCLPLVTRRGVLGVLYVDSNAAIQVFREEDLDRLQSLCGHIALHLENAQLLEERRQIEQARRQAMEEEISTLRDRLAEREILVGESPGMRRVLEQVGRVAGTDATVLVLGETGTGKESIAQLIHRSGPRAKGPFVVIDPGTVPETLLESELFGHERGAFTGADARRIGRFEQAAGGTVFLDEVGDLPLRLQGRLLRVLEERTIQRVGGARPIPVDVRIVAATNKDLPVLVEAGELRSDLYYRLNVFRLEVPPLRERAGDLELLARHFLTRFGVQYGRPGLALSPGALRALAAHDWPGNVRELKHRIQRGVIAAAGGRLEAADLEMTDPAGAPYAGSDDAWRRLEAELDRQVTRAASGEQAGPLFRQLVQPLEAGLCRRALDRSGGNKAAAARLLGIERRRLTRILTGEAEPLPEPDRLGKILDCLVDDRIGAGDPAEDLLHRIQDRVVRAALERAGPNRRRLAELLGLAPATLRRRLAALDSLDPGNP